MDLFGVRKFLAGSNARTAVQTAQHLLERHRLLPILDYVSEGSGNLAQQDEIIRAYKACSAAMPPRTLYAVKLQPFIMYDGFWQRKQANRLVDAILENQGVVVFDAEDARTHAATQAFIDARVRAANGDGILRAYKTYQMYRLDAMATLLKDVDRNPCMGVKLVRGAYHHRDARSGLLFPTLQETHNAYNQAARWLLQQQKQHASLQILFATHNEDSVRAILKHAPPTQGVAFAQLLGMNDPLSLHTRDAGYPTYKYLPFGPLWQALPYLMRRFLERPSVLTYLSPPSQIRLD